MGVLRIQRDTIDRLVLYGGRKRQTAQQVLNSLTEKPDYIINALMYDTVSGISSATTIVEGERINEGNYTDKGIGFNNVNDLTECERPEALAKGFKYFMGGSPNLLWNGKLDIDRFAPNGAERFTRYETEIATAIRIGFGYTDKEIIVYYTPNKTTMKHVGEYLLKLGCKAAINLDGGGSTKVCKVVNGKLENLNNPTENRPNSTWILVYLKKDAKPTTTNTTTNTSTSASSDKTTTATSTTSKGVTNTMAKYTVMLDPGHGGTDPGAVGPTKLEEADVALKIAEKVKPHLERCGITVKMSRTTDTLTSLAARTKAANSGGVSRFVSIHCNAATYNGAKGIETFCYQLSGTGYSMANAIQNQLIAATGETNRGVKADKSLYVLNSTTMAACLVECGFISNPDTEAKFKNSDYLETIAEAIAKGICAHLNVTWKEFEKYDTSDWKVAAMKRVCEEYSLDMDTWYEKKDQNITVGEMFGILNKILTKVEG